MNKISIIPALLFAGALTALTGCNQLTDPALSLTVLASVQSGCQASMCHASTALKQSLPTSGLHTVHLNSRKLDQSDSRCLNCHWNYTNNPLHRNGRIDSYNAATQTRTPVSVVDFGGNLAFDSSSVSGGFSADSANCSSVLCHKSASSASLNWYVEADCAACHRLGSSIDPMTTNGSGSSGKHTTHVQGRGVYCSVCHSNYKNVPSHMNGIYGRVESSDIVNIRGSWSIRTNVAGEFSRTDGRCSNTSCHMIPASSFSYTFPGGDGEPVLNTVTAGGIPTVSPSWNSTGQTCTACHGNPPGTGSGPYTWHSGSHGSNSASNQCQFCHSDATGSGGLGTAITDALLHLNGSIEVTAVFTSGCFGCH